MLLPLLQNNLLAGVGALVISDAGNIASLEAFGVPRIFQPVERILVVDLDGAMMRVRAGDGAVVRVSAEDGTMVRVRDLDGALIGDTEDS